MKLCPQCHTPYTDSSLNYCLKDGVALIEDVPSGYASKVDTLKFPSEVLNKVVCTDKWLHDIAEKERIDIHKYVMFIRGVVSSSRIKEDKPCIDFIFNVLNCSVFSVTIDDEIDGYIRFSKRHFEGNLELIQNSVKNLPHSRIEVFALRQWLNREDVEYIIAAPDDDWFYFDRIYLTVKGGDSFPQVRRQRLEIEEGIEKRATYI